MIDRYEEASTNVVDMTSCFIADATKFECTTLQKVAMEDLHMAFYIDPVVTISVAVVIYAVAVTLVAVTLMRSDERRRNEDRVREYFRVRR